MLFKKEGVENISLKKSFSHKETLERDKKPIQLVTYREGPEGNGDRSKVS